MTQTIILLEDLNDSSRFVIKYDLNNSIDEETIKILGSKDIYQGYNIIKCWYNVTTALNFGKLFLEDFELRTKYSLGFFGGRVNFIPINDDELDGSEFDLNNGAILCDDYFRKTDKLNSIFYINFINKYVIEYNKLFKKIDIDYATDIRKSRRKGSGGTQEFYTPFSIVQKMCLKIPEKDWQDPTKLFCEPCFGNGNILILIIDYRIKYGIDWKTALETLYGVELCEDNVLEARYRVHELLRNISPDYDPKVADEIMDKNFVCHDFFTWDFEHWRAYSDEELKRLDKKVSSKKTEMKYTEEELKKKIL